MVENYEGYTEEAVKILQKFDANTWDRVKITNQDTTHEGIILPRNKFNQNTFVTLKLDSGYNIGVSLTDTTEITIISKEKPMAGEFKGKPIEDRPDLPNVMLLGTGGTIASRLDYATGGVIPTFEPNELFAAVPELAEICNLSTETVFKIFSEDMKPQYWEKLAEKIVEVAPDYDGILIGHGTDTLSYTAAALSFLIKDLPIPVILVGSQRSSDRPSSDAAINLINAATAAAKGDFAEVCICMLGTTDHIYGFIHRGTRVRKMHSSVRHTFRTLGDIPLGAVSRGNIQFFKENLKRRDVLKEKSPQITGKLEPNVALLYSYPGMSPEILEHYIEKDYKGLILAGTGLGHVPHDIFSQIEIAVKNGMTVVMVVQTLGGYTGMDVYETGRELQAIGVIPGHNMLPEVAYVKLMWILGQTSDPKQIRELMVTNIAGEITDGEPINGFDLRQGVEDRLRALPRIESKKVFPHFEFLEHTADVWIHAFGNTLEESFEQCVYAMMSVMTDPARIRANTYKNIRIVGKDKEELLVHFLNEFLVLFDTEGFIVHKILIESITEQNGEYELGAKALGEPFDGNRHLKDTEIKAITYMQISIKEIDGHWEIKIVFDI